MGDKLWFADFLLPGVPIADVWAAYDRAPGNELAAGKLASPDSSAALVANTFGFFIRRPADLPRIPGLAGAGWPPESVAVERCLRFPWSGGRHPWLDVVIETRTHLVGIESKRLEPFRGAPAGSFSPAYRRRVWGPDMAPYEALRDELATPEGRAQFRHLDAVQLVKHAFALRTQARATRNRRRPVLVYLHAEPTRWPGTGAAIPKAQRERHAEEIARFKRRVAGAEVAFVACTYASLLAAMAKSRKADVRAHAAGVAGRYAV